VITICCSNAMWLLQTEASLGSEFVGEGASCSPTLSGVRDFVGGISILARDGGEIGERTELQVCTL
jgi:hypothetical protein